jgi:hypothetical protein
MICCCHVETRKIDLDRSTGGPGNWRGNLGWLQIESVLVREGTALANWCIYRSMPFFFSVQRRVDQSTKYLDTIWDAACGLLQGFLGYLGRNGYLEIDLGVFSVLLLNSPG